MRHSWRVIAAVIVTLGAASVATVAVPRAKGPVIVYGATGPCCHPPPPFNPAVYFGPRPGEMSTDPGERRAADYAHRARFGARVKIYAGAAGLPRHQRRVAEHRARLAARRLVGLGVYPGSIEVVWSAAPHHHRGLAIAVRRMAAGF